MAAITSADYVAGIQSTEHTVEDSAAVGALYDPNTQTLRGLSEKHESVAIVPPLPPPEPPDARQLQLF